MSRAGTSGRRTSLNRRRNRRQARRLRVESLEVRRMLATVDVEGFIWHDVNENGVRDDEPHLEGRVELWFTDSASGDADVYRGKTTWSARGEYRVTASSPTAQRYFLRFYPPPTMRFTERRAFGINLVNDSDVFPASHVTDFYPLTETIRVGDAGLIGELPTNGYLLPMGGELDDISFQVKLDIDNVMTTLGTCSKGFDADAGAGTAHVCSVDHGSYLAQYAAKTGAILNAGDIVRSTPTSSVLATDFETDSFGITVIGRLDGQATATFGSKSIPLSSDKRFDIFALRTSSPPIGDWSFTIGSDGFDLPTALASSDNTVSIGATVSGVADLDPGTGEHIVIPPEGGVILAVSEFNTSDGSFQRATTFPSARRSNEIIDIVVDDENNHYYAINFSGEIDVNPDPDAEHVVSADSSGTVIVKLNSERKLHWATPLPSTGDMRITDLLYHRGAIVGTGKFSGTAQLGSQSLQAANFDAVVARLDAADGSIDAAKAIGATDFAVGQSVAAYADRVVVTGGFLGTIQTPDSTLRATSFGAFVYEVDYDLSTVYRTGTIDGDGIDDAYGISANNDHVCVVGEFDDTIEVNGLTEEPITVEPPGQNADSFVACVPTDTANQADIDVRKTVDIANPKVGQTVVYTVTVANHGPADATGVAIDDVIPQGLSVLSRATSQGDYDEAKGRWTVGDLSATSPNNTATLELVVDVDPESAGKSLVNTVIVTARDQADGNVTNDVSSASIDVQAADLELDLTVTDTEPQGGDTGTVTVKVTNSGPDTAGGITVAFLPLDYPQTPRIVPEPSQGTYDPISGLWVIGELPSGAAAALLGGYFVQPSPEGATIRNSAEIVTSNQGDPDSTPANGKPEEDDQDAVVISVPPDVKLDWGDAEGTGFPTRVGQDGARHVPRGATLGELRDTESDGQPSPDALGDDASPSGGESDEDGLLFHAIPTSCNGIARLDVRQTAGEPYYLNAWADFSGNGTWGDDGEQIAANDEIRSDGIHSIVFPVPEGTQRGNAVARFRLSKAKDLGIGGEADDGEVEDYVLEIGSAPNNVFVDDDFAGMAPGQDPDGDGPATAMGYDAFAQVQQGVNCVAVGGTVHVNEGTYGESVDVEKTVSIVGKGNETVIDPLGLDGLTIAADYVAIADLRVTDAEDGIVATGVKAPSLVRVESSRNTGAGFRGEQLTGSLVVSGGDYSHNQQQGFDLTTVGDIVFEERVAVENNKSFGVFVLEAESFSYDDGIVANNDDDGIRLIQIGGDVTLSGTIFADNDAADVIEDPLFSLPPRGGAGFYAVGDQLKPAIGGNLLVDAIFRASPNRGQEHGLVASGVKGTAIVRTASFNGHRGAGLQIEHAGNVTIEGGHYLDNQDGIVISETASLTAFDVVANNRGTNLGAYDVKIVNVIGGSYDNGERGVEVYGAGDNVAQVTAVQANGNARENLVVLDTRSLTVADGLFEEGGGFGVRLSRVNGAARIIDTSVFGNDDHNLLANEVRVLDITNTSLNLGGQNGIMVTKSENVTLNEVNANASANHGVEIRRSGNVTINAGSFSNGRGSGIYLEDLSGPVILTDVSANDNDLDNLAVFDAPSLSINGGSYQRSLESTGIIASGIGSVGLNEVEASGNERANLAVGDSGVMRVANSSFQMGKAQGVGISNVKSVFVSYTTVDHNAETGLALVHVDESTIGQADFSNNGGVGIAAIQIGALDLEGVVANENKDPGLLVAGATRVTSITGGSFNGNGVGGMILHDMSDVNINDVNVDDNKVGHGIDIQNSRDVSVRYGSVLRNAKDGIHAENVQNVTTYKVQGIAGDPGVYVRGAASYSDFGSVFSDNTDGGVFLENISGDVTFTQTTVNNNDTNGDGVGAGIHLSEVSGRVTIDSVTANDNAQGILVNAGVVAGIKDSVLTRNAVGLQNDGGRVLLQESDVSQNAETNLLNENGGVVETASRISGYVYVDDNNDGVFQDTEIALPNVPITLLESTTQEVLAEAATFADGAYEFDLIWPGQVTVIERHPVVYGDGRESVGTDADGNLLPAIAENDQFRNVELSAGTEAVNFNFGEGPLQQRFADGQQLLDLTANGSDLLARHAVPGQGAYRLEADRDRTLVAAGPGSFELYTSDFLPTAISALPRALEAAISEGQSYILIATGNDDFRMRVRVTDEPLEFTNPINPLDINADGVVAPVDALIGINDLNSAGARPLGQTKGMTYYLDVNGDGHSTAIDVLSIVNHLNARQGEGELFASAEYAFPWGVSSGAMRTAFWPQVSVSRSATVAPRRVSSDPAAPWHLDSLRSTGPNSRDRVMSSLGNVRSDDLESILDVLVHDLARDDMVHGS